jgi:hypothetical protein
LADNRTNQEASWDEDLLGPELAELRDLDFDLSLTGFDRHEINDFLADPNAADLANAAPEPPANPVSRPGDLLICGEHRILCGDATKLEAIEAVLDGGLADMALGDPPYSVS